MEETGEMSSAAVGRRRALLSGVSGWELRSKGLGLPSGGLQSPVKGGTYHMSGMVRGWGRDVGAHRMGGPR